MCWSCIDQCVIHVLINVLVMCWSCVDHVLISVLIWSLCWSLCWSMCWSLRKSLRLTVKILSEWIWKTLNGCKILGFSLVCNLQGCLENQSCLNEIGVVLMGYTHKGSGVFSRMSKWLVLKNKRTLMFLLGTVNKNEKH